MWPIARDQLLQATQGVCSDNAQPAPKLSRICTDSRKVQQGDLFVALRGETFDGHAFIATAFEKGAAYALVEKSWHGFKDLGDFEKNRCVRVEDTLHAFRALASFFRSRFSFPVIGIGGSNGKTTTKEMLAALLSSPGKKVTRTAKSENGFLGLAITLCSSEHIASAMPDDLVLEIGIDTSGAMSEHVALSQPTHALLTALGPEHLAGLGSWENAAAEEYKLFSESAKTCVRIWQAEDEKLREHLGDKRRGDVIVCTDTNSLLRNRDYSDEALKQEGIRIVRYIFSTQNERSSQLTLHDNITNSSCSFSIPLPGAHNAQNFALAVGAALALGRNWNDLQTGWRGFVPPDMRSRVVTLNNGTVLFDDCYNASPASVKAAIAVIQGAEWKDKEKVVVLGDMLDLGGESKKWHLELVCFLKELRNTRLCLFGEAMYDVYKAITNETNFVTKGNNTLRYLKPSDDPTAFVDDSPAHLASMLVLVKGSRGMDLGRVVKFVTDKCNAEG